MATILPPRERFGPNICGDLTEANQREWLVSNGLGSYACGTISGIQTRRYHGLLIAALQPPADRYLLFSKAQTILLDGSDETLLYANCYADQSIEPRGYRHIEAFEIDGRMPVWHYRVGGIKLEMRIWMEPCANTTYIAYRLDPSNLDVDLQQYKVKCEILVNIRDHHSISERQGFATDAQMNGQTCQLTLPHEHYLHIKAVGGDMHMHGEWRAQVHLAEEQKLGLQGGDCHYQLGHAMLNLTPGRWVGIVCSLHEDASTDLRAALNRFRSRDIEMLKRAKTRVEEFENATDWVNRMLLATDHFIFSRPVEDLPNGESVIAGYPWLGDFGRQTMMALPGLTLATGRYDSARRILQTFGRFIDQGMLPNEIPGNGEAPRFTSVDASLWYIEAWRSYLKATQDLRSLHKIYPVLQRIIIACLKGTRHGIEMDADDGLLACGDGSVALTWMNGHANGEYVTPRIGKPVEINALWFNAVNTMTRFAYQLGLNPNPYGDLVKKTLRGFQRFVRAKDQGMYDVLDGPQGHDETIRPNQIMAVSLPYSPLDQETMARVVNICNKELLTAYGLRTLSPRHPQYQPRIKGDAGQQTKAWYQGGVWAWLLGHYALAEYRVHKDALAAQSRLSGLQDHMQSGALGNIGEVFDGAAPHASHGAIAHACAVACNLEAWWKLEKAKKIVRITPESQTQSRIQRILAMPV